MSIFFLFNFIILLSNYRYVFVHFFTFVVSLSSFSCEKLGNCLGVENSQKTLG